MRTSRTEITSRACDRDFGVVLRTIKASRARGTALLSCVGVVVASLTPQRAAGSIAAVRSSTTHGTTDHIFRSRSHCPASANVPARALTELPVTRCRNTSTITRGTQRSDIAHNARHQSVGGWSIAAMYVVGCRATSANAPERLERNHTSQC
jgi:hypothetical protein